jgi:hypothetical protein
MAGALQNIKMQIMSSGQEVEDSIIMKQYILPHLKTQLIEIQTLVFAEYSVDEGNERYFCCVYGTMMTTMTTMTRKVMTMIMMVMLTTMMMMIYMLLMRMMMMVI